jgi:hypothetical protein
MLWKYSDADYINYINNVTNKPPTVYFLLDSIVNYGKDEKTKIKDLASAGRTRFFNFDYPLTTKVDKATFETNILNHFMMRRIGAETFTAFQINLNAKLNEIMPLYNMMFDSLDGIDLLNESYTKSGTDNSNTTNSIENNSNTTSDRRYSDTPQNRLSEVQSGEYVTEYNLDTNNDTSTSEGESENTRTYSETYRKSPSNLITHLKEAQKEIKSIYSLIYEDLDDLFYGII